MNKNKLLFAVISLLLALIFSNISAFAADNKHKKTEAYVYVEYLAGDVDGNLVVDINDVTTYQLTLVGKMDETAAFIKNSSTYTDQMRSIRDVTAIQLYLTGQLRKLPVTPDGYYSEIMRP